MTQTLELKYLGSSKVPYYTLSEHVVIRKDTALFEINGARNYDMDEGPLRYVEDYTSDQPPVLCSSLTGLMRLTYIQERSTVKASWNALVEALTKEAAGKVEQPAPIESEPPAPANEPTPEPEPAEKDEAEPPAKARRGRRKASEVKEASPDAETKLKLLQQIFGGGSSTDELSRQEIEELKERVASLENKAPSKLEISVNSVTTGAVEGLKHEMFEPVIKRVANKIHVFLTGPAGSGKSHMCRQIAEALGVKFYFQNAVTNPWEITGFVDANGSYHETEFYKAFTEGGVFLLDEVDASSPDVLTVLNAALSNRMFPFPNNPEPAMQHENFYCLCAGNTYGTGADMKYVGRNQLDAATLDRFDVVMMDYSPAIESNLIPADLLEFANLWRKACNTNSVKHICSTRCLIDMAKLDKAGIDPEDFLESRLIKNLNKTDLSSITLAVKENGSSSNVYVKALDKVNERRANRRGGC